MGHEIVYCSLCRTRLSGVDFEKGLAYRLGHRIGCKTCVPRILATLPEAEREALLNEIQRKESGGEAKEARAVLATAEPSTPHPRPPPLDPVAERPRWILPAAGIAAAAAGFVVLMLLMERSPESGSGAQEVGSVSPPAPPPVPPAEEARIRAAKLALQEAQRFMKAHPGDLEGQIAAYAEAVRLCANTPQLRDAREAHAALMARRRAAVPDEVPALEAQVRPLLAAEEFGAAIAVWEGARARPTMADRAALIDQKVAETRRAAETLWASLKAGARQKGSEADVKAFRDRAARWGRPDLAADLERELASSRPETPPVKPPSKEALEYLSRWKEAALLAGARDFEAAIAKLKAAAGRIVEVDVQREAAQDVEDLVRILALHKEACRTLSEWPRGRSITLEWLTETGERKRVTGRAVRTDPYRVEVAPSQGGAFLFVEFSDVTATALSEILKGRGGTLAPDDARRTALWGLLEGEVVAWAGPSETIPEKYREHARDAAGKLPRPSAREFEARSLFHQAEREFREVKTLGEAVEKYKKLLSDYPDTRVVKGDADLITHRTAAGKEYFLRGADLRGRGTFRFARREKVDICWTSASDSDASALPENFVEFEFYAVPDTTYRCWVYLGACCAETFSHSWQASDLKGPNPRNPKQIVAAEPGGASALPLKPRIGGLKTLHAAHGGRKEPTRWEWVALPLPKFPAAGLKTVRLLTDQQGFSVAQVSVSALRQTPPSRQEVEKELQKAPRPSVVAEEGLVGYWKFDEGQGSTASDSSVQGAPGVLVGMNAAAWVEGCPTTGWANPFALEFDGKDDFVKVDQDALLNSLGNRFTLAAWVHPNATREGWQTVFARQSGASGNHVFILRLDSRNIADFRFTTTQHAGTALGGDPLTNRQWTHLACVCDGSALKLYINGAEVTSVPFGGALPEDRNPLTIGAAEFDAQDGLGCPFEGRIDDVRVYNCPLSATQLQALAGKAVPK